MLSLILNRLTSDIISRGVLYFDVNGQWNRVGGKYDYFKPNGPFDIPNYYNLENTMRIEFIDYLLDEISFEMLNFRS